MDFNTMTNEQIATEMRRTQQKATFRLWKANAIARNLGKTLWKDYFVSTEVFNQLKKFQLYIRQMERAGTYEKVFKQ